MEHESIVITGSSGTIGTALADKLLEQGYDVTGVDIMENRWLDYINNHSITADITDQGAFDDLPPTPDLVIHLAANARVHKLVQNPTLAKENFDTTFNVMEYAREAGADVIFASSREVYGKNGKIIYSETDTYVDECESPYTASKIGGEALVKSYGKCYDIDVSIARFSNVYGKYDSSDRVVPLFIAQASNGENLTVYGDNKVLDFTYIDDCVYGILQMIEEFNKAFGTTFNIASGRGTSLSTLAEIIVNELEADVSISVEENRTGEVSRYVADTTKAEKILGYDPDSTIREGIAETIAWYRERPEIQIEILDSKSK
jgi:UDP-glucose 4-epimerase